MFADLLGGMLGGFTQGVEQQRVKTRAEEDQALEAKRDVGRHTMEKLGRGETHDAKAVPILQDYMNSFGPRPSVGGTRGMFGHTQQPEMPQLDALMSGETQWSGPEGVFRSPEEDQQRETEWLIGRQGAIETASLKQWRDNLPGQIAMLVSTLNVNPDMARNILLAQKFGENVLGIKGTDLDFWDPVSKRMFRGRRDPMMGGIVDLASGDVIKDARAVKLDEQTNWETGEVSYIDSYSGQVLHTVDGTRGGPRPMNPYWMPQQGLVGLVGPGGVPQTRPMTDFAPGFQPPPQLNPAADEVRFRFNQVEQAVRQQMALLEDTPDWMSDRDGASRNLKLKAIQDSAARQWNFPDYATAQQQVGGTPLRTPQVITGLPRSNTAGTGTGAPAAPAVQTPIGTAQMPKPGAAPQPPKLLELRTGTDPRTGQTVVRQWNGSAWIPFVGNGGGR